MISDVTDSIRLETCESGMMEVRCPDDYRIWIQSMFFGRSSNDTCPHESANTTECEATGALDLVRHYCDGRNECYVHAITELFGDACEGVSKHASLEFVCHCE